MSCQLWAPLMQGPQTQLNSTFWSQVLHHLSMLKQQITKLVHLLKMPWYSNICGSAAAWAETLLRWGKFTCRRNCCTLNNGSSYIRGAQIGHEAADIERLSTAATIRRREWEVQGHVHTWESYCGCWQSFALMQRVLWSRWMWEGKRGCWSIAWRWSSFVELVLWKGP